MALSARIRMSCTGSPARLVGIALTGQAAGADHPGPTFSAVTCLASTSGQVAL
jgi:hypothetical protein